MIPGGYTHSWWIYGGFAIQSLPSCFHFDLEKISINPSMGLPYHQLQEMEPDQAGKWLVDETRWNQLLGDQRKVSDIALELGIMQKTGPNHDQIILLHSNLRCLQALAGAMC